MRLWPVKMSRDTPKTRDSQVELVALVVVEPDEVGVAAEEEAFLRNFLLTLTALNRLGWDAFVVGVEDWEEFDPSWTRVGRIGAALASVVARREFVSPAS